MTPFRSCRCRTSINLLTDPKEEYPKAASVAENLWVRWPIGKVLTDHMATLQKEPPIRPGTPDPYVPKR